MVKTTLLFTADSGSTSLTNASYHKQSIRQTQRHIISSEKPLPCIKNVILENRKLCPTYLAPTPQCIRLRAMAKFKLPQTHKVALPVALASLAVLFSQVAITQTAPLTHKSHKQAPTSTGHHYFWRSILDLPCLHTPQIRRKTLAGRNTKVCHPKNHLNAS